MSEDGDTMSWQPSLGAWPNGGGTHFRVWAPRRGRVEVVLESGDRSPATYPLARGADGTFHGLIAEVGAGALYRYRLDGEGPFPDPASRFQPEGVHGASMVIEPRRYAWGDQSWPGLRLEELVLYELHVGTFTPAGTFAAAGERLDYLRDLGATALELMPVADFPGRRGWGYDGVSLFAPARCYGTPDDLRRLVDRAHGVGLGVFLDVVYNHLGPDGAYLGAFSPYYFSPRHKTPWGDAVNLDGEHSAMVRDFFIENALHWIHEYHLDGLRLDATHALIDDGTPHFLAELAERVGAMPRPGARRALLVAEDHRNLPALVRPRAEGGCGLDAVWADDFHHQVRRAVAGDREGYYRDYTGSTADLAATIGRGWFYCGQYSEHLQTARGSDPSGVPPRCFVVCLQNHDQVGNRALGERLHHQIDAATYRAVTVLLLCAPETPLLFMGQEWAASSPFLYFTDHDPELGRLVTEGRRREFRSFSAFRDSRARERIPDPQAESTFGASRLPWDECAEGRHAETLRLYRALLQLRRQERALCANRWQGFAATAPGDGALRLCFTAGAGSSLQVVIRLRGAGEVSLDVTPPGGEAQVETLLSTEDERFAADPVSPEFGRSGANSVIRFARPGALILRVSGAAAVV